MRRTLAILGLLVLGACAGAPAVCVVKYEGDITTRLGAVKSGVTKGDCYALTRPMQLFHADGVEEYLFINDKAEADDHLVGALPAGTRIMSEKIGQVTSCDGGGNSSCQSYTATIGKIASGAYIGQSALLPAALEEVTELNGTTHIVTPPITPCSN